MAGELNYILVDNKLKNGKGYMPRTVTAINYDRKELIKRMARSNTDCSIGKYERFFRDLEETMLQVLAEGGSLKLGEYIKISPVVRGRFDKIDEPFHRSKHKIDVVAKVSTALVKEVAMELSVERVDQRSKVADLRELRSGAGKNIAELHGINTITGGRLKPRGDRLAGLTLHYRYDIDRKVTIPVEELNIASYSGGKLIFGFHHTFKLPPQLAGEEELVIRLEFYSEAKKRHYHSSQLAVKWSEE